MNGEGREAVTLLLNLFVDTTVAIVAGVGGGLAPALIYATVFLANHEPGIARDGRCQPASLRPISLRALSRSIGLDRETVRRHLIDLRARNLCAASDAGIIVTDDAPVRGALAAIRQGLDGQTAWATGGSPLPIVWTGTAPPILAIRGLAIWVRVFSDCAPAFAADYELAWLFINIGVLNTEHLRNDPALAATMSAHLTLPDSIKRPATVAAIARRAAVALETTRRRVQRLIALGHCAKRAGGVIALESAISDPRLWRLMARAPAAFRTATRDSPA